MPWITKPLLHLWFGSLRILTSGKIRVSEVESVGLSALRRTSMAASQLPSCSWSVLTGVCLWPKGIELNRKLRAQPPLVSAWALPWLRTHRPVVPRLWPVQPDVWFYALLNLHFL